jgi:hypothetical protein
MKSRKDNDSKDLSRRGQEEEGMVCEMVRFRDMDRVARNTRNAQYMCTTCGRGAIEATSLCNAESI